jgi:hypothetical protein
LDEVTEPIDKIWCSIAKSLSGEQGLESRDESSTNIEISQRRLISKEPLFTIECFIEELCKLLGIIYSLLIGLLVFSSLED